MELQDYLLVVRKRWRLLVLVVLTTVMLAAGASLMATKEYASTSQYFVSTTGSADSVSLLQGSTFTQQRVKSYTQLLTTPRILDPVAEAVGSTSTALSGQVTATTPPDTVLIEVSVRDSDPARAKAIGDAIATEFPSAVTELESPQGAKASPVKVTVVQPPTTPTSPVSPKPVRNLALGVVLGLLLGLGAAVLREMLDKGVKTTDDVKRITDSPILGTIAHD
ncbi:MAG: cell shape-determining protein, partial [Micrococcales bacterium]|nr:cell shape-determining protein [Micrococcales bacterium]